MMFKAENNIDVLFSEDGASWKKNDKYHREVGPAVILPGRISWHRQGKYHREGGPAIIYTDDGDYYWYISGKICYTEFGYNMACFKEKLLGLGFKVVKQYKP